MPIYEYVCQSCAHVKSALVNLDERDEPQECSACGDNARRAILTPPKIDNLAMAYQKNASPEFADRYERMCRQRKDKEAKSLAEHGDYGPAPGAD